MILEISSDSECWMHVKQALREAGYKYYLQENRFGPNKTLFTERRGPEPEGGKLTHGMVVYDGGCIVGSTVQEVYDQEIGKQ